MKFNPNKNRVYKKATHCKMCKKSFEEVNRYEKHAMCYKCYNNYQRRRNNMMPFTITTEYKIKNRAEVYKERAAELKGIKKREEWLKVLERNLLQILDELQTIKVKEEYDN